MADLMICEIVTPDQRLFSGDAVLVSAPAAEGEIGFMYLCSPLMSTLRRGCVRVKKTETSEPQRFAVDGGYVEADGYRVVVLASRAIDINKVDTSISKERIAANEKRLAELSPGDSRAVFMRQEIEWQTYLINAKTSKE